MNRIIASIVCVLLVVCNGCTQKKQSTILPKKSGVTVSAQIRDPFVPLSPKIQAFLKQKALNTGAQDTRKSFSDYNIKETQGALQKAGFYNGPIDGVMGKKTIQALEDFQRANKLQVDGKLGKNTWKVLSQFNDR